MFIFEACVIFFFLLMCHAVSVGFHSLSEIVSLDKMRRRRFWLLDGRGQNDAP